MEKKQISKEWVTVAVVSQLYEALMLQSVLEENGIAVFLKDEITAQTYANPISGVKVQVPDLDAQRAYELLLDGGYLS